jgi:NAD-dependent DNA ligase
MPGTVKLTDQIMVRDLVNSTIYNRQKVKYFFFVGRPIGRYLISDIKRKIEEFGGQVLSTVTPEITYVVIGEDFEDDANYVKSTHLGAVVLRERELYDLLGLKWTQ